MNGPISWDIEMGGHLHGRSLILGIYRVSDGEGEGVSKTDILPDILREKKPSNNFGIR